MAKKSRNNSLEEIVEQAVIIGIRIYSNAIASVLGKTNSVTKQLYDAINDEANGKFSLLYWNKKDAITLLQSAGLQLPGSLIPRDGFIHSIRENNSPVKYKFINVTESRQFVRWFGDRRNHRIIHEYF